MKRASTELNRGHLGELYEGHDRYDPVPIDASLRDDFQAGRLDRAILEALEDEAHGRT